MAKPRIVCVLCGLIVMFDQHGSVGSYPSKCSANAGGNHIEPGTPEADRAKELHAAWLRDPMRAPDR